MKVELNYYDITILGLFIANLFNWLDGLLTYIALYIIPTRNFSELNNFNWNMFNSVGWYNAFAFKIAFCLFVTLIIYYMVHFSIVAKKRITNNILIISFIICLFMIIFPTFKNTLYLIFYYIR
jgi:hypothetical protein